MSNWKNNDNKAGKGRRNGRGPRKAQWQNNNCNSARGQRNFPKFADNDYINNESNYWPQNDWQYDKNSNNSFNNNANISEAGIFPWIRKHPVNPLIIPPIEQINNESYNEDFLSNKVNAQPMQEPVENMYLHNMNDKEISVTRSRNNSVSTTTKSDAGVAEAPKTTIDTIFTGKINQEKDLAIKLKQEKKSSSSSSSSESSSNDEEPETSKKPAVVVKKEVTTEKSSTSPLNIKLKPKANLVNSTPVKTAQKSKAKLSSSDEEASPPSPPPAKSSAKVETNSKLEEDAKKEIKTKKKNRSEDDVVCIGSLENKIVLEDESEEDEDIESEIEIETTILTKKSMKSAKKSTEKCLICDKKGHTSFQCQMICRNCSGPYHGYRTCPQPANLNTMLQLYMEFCMQQLQNFNVAKQIAPNASDSFPKPQVDSPYLLIGNNKSKKFKRKQVMASETNAKTKTSKKRKLSITKKKSSKCDSDDSTDDNKNDSDLDSSSTESEGDCSDSPLESVVSSKKLNMKNKNASKGALNLSNFTTIPANIPLVLNGFPNLTVGSPTAQNPTNSANALNNLLLTQMFQNAIGSLRQ